MKSALDMIRGYCEHLDDENGELCECSSPMDKTAREALAKLGKGEG